MQENKIEQFTQEESAESSEPEVTTPKTTAETKDQYRHDTERAQNLLGNRYNPYEVSDIFSYFKPEQTDQMLGDLEQRLSMASEDEKDSIRSAWLGEAKKGTEQTMSHGGKED